MSAHAYLTGVNQSSSMQEIEANEDDTVEVDMSVGRVIVNEPRLKVDLTKFTERHAFTFDGCLNENVSNDDVYKITVQPLVTTIFRQGKATCFAYGQTGSGKTYTMQVEPMQASLPACNRVAVANHATVH